MGYADVFGKRGGEPTAVPVSRSRSPAPGQDSVLVGSGGFNQIDVPPSWTEEANEGNTWEDFQNRLRGGGYEGLTGQRDNLRTMQQQGPLMQPGQERQFGQIDPRAFQMNQGMLDTLGQRGQTSFDQQQQALGDYQGARGGQMDAAQRLLGIAGEQGPSVAQMQLQRGMESSIAAAQAQAASAQGINPALAARGAQSGAENARAQAVQSAGFLRAQEEKDRLLRAMQATQAAGGMMRGVAGQDLGAADMGLRGAQGYGQLGLQGEGMRMGADQGLESMIQGAYGRTLGAERNTIQDALDAWRTKKGLDVTTRGQNIGLVSTLAGGALGGAAAGGAKGLFG